MSDLVITLTAAVLLAPLFSTDTQWKPMILIYPVFMVVAGIWIYVDASERVGNGCFWGTLAFAVPPIGVPLYYLSLLYMAISSSQRNREEDAQRQRMEEQRRRYVMQGDIERARDEAAWARDGGTRFNPAAGMGMQTRGFRYFTDNTVEELLQARRFSEARIHLEDMLALAREDSDTQRIETYRWYLAQLPELPPNAPVPPEK